MKKIAIIGAGVAGLTALQTLSKHGCSVTVFDKSRGSGGRLSSKKSGDSSWDMGAQFMRAHTDEFKAQLKIWEADGWVAHWDVTPWAINGTQRTASPDDIDRYVGMPRMTGLSRKLLEAADDFITQTRIIETQFNSESGTWSLTADDGTEFGPFDELIINTPPQQALPLLPAESQLSEQVSGIHMLPCWTLLLGFEDALECAFDAAFVKSGPISWIARNNSKPGRDAREAWVIQANHEWSERKKDAPREQVQQELEEAFAIATGCTAAPSDIWLHRWLYSLPANSSGLGALRDEAHNLTLCGDWCLKPSIEGAWLSGRAAAHILTGTHHD
tara:strand:- start:15214 stop:16203 length:990 start_codon:yes stop_codon:yes gene_type:complete